MVQSPTNSKLLDRFSGEYHVVFHNLELSVEVYPSNYILYFNSWTSLSNAVLIQGISIIFTDQMPTCHVFRIVHSYVGVRIFRSLTRGLISLTNEKASLKGAERIYLNTRSLPCRCIFFFCIKMIRNTVYKMFLVIFAVMILYNLHTLYIWYIYNLFRIMLSFWQNYGCMELIN
jgi:hypothetical protein